MPRSLVHFRIRDCYHPDPRLILDRLHGDDLLQGEVVEMVAGTPPGEQGRPIDYVTIAVEGLDDLAIVPRHLVQWSLRNGSVR